MQKRKIVVFLVCFLLSLNIFSGEFQVNISYGIYSKDYNLFKELYGNDTGIFGLGADYFFSKFFGVYIESNYMSAGGESSHNKIPLSYNETHLSAGAKFRYPLFGEFELYLKAGVLYVNYSETFAEQQKGHAVGITGGGGFVYWIKKFGLGIEMMQNIASKTINIQGLDSAETVSFNGLRIVLKGMLRL